MLLVLAVQLPAAAATHSAALVVTARVDANCVVHSASALNFGTYVWTHAGEPLDATANALTIACTRGATGVAIALGAGQHASGTYRGLSSGNATVRYQVYTSPDRTVVWDVTNTVQYVPVNSQPVDISMYGRVVANEQPPPGLYSDVLLAAVNF